jgi:hypothetical protein
VKVKTCSICGAQFVCGPQDEEEDCWCCDYPPIMPLDFSQDCRCPACLKEIVKEKIAEYLKTITPENALNSIAPKYATNGRLVEEIDYYLNENGQFVMTAWYLLKRGYCCKNGCKHCPYGYQKL